MKKGALIVAALIALALAACEYRVTGYSEQPKTTDAGSVKYVYAVVNWVDSVDQIAAGCPHASGNTWEGCAQVQPDSKFPDTASCTIYVLKPDSFNDQVRLVILGHEFWHCLGAEHERN